MMGFTSDEEFVNNLAQQPAAPDFHTPTFGEKAEHLVQDATKGGAAQFGASFSSAGASGLENDLTTGGVSDDFMLARQYEPIVDTLNRVQQRQPASAFSSGNLIQNPFSEGARNNPHALDDLWGQVAQERARNPGLFGQLPQNHAEVLADAQAEQRAAADYARMTAAKGGFITGTVASFLGGAAGGFADPVNIAASVIGFPASESLLKTALIEGGGNMAITAATLPQRYTHYQDIGEPMSAGDVAGELAGAGGIGAGFGVAGKLIGKVLGLSGHALVDEFHAQVPDPAPNLRTAAAMVEDQADRAQENPFSPGPAGEDLHRQALIQAQGALDEGAPNLLPQIDQPLDRAADPAIEAAIRKAGYQIESFDPADMSFDAAAMQFKRGGDEQGVTDRLQGVQNWDPTKAGLMLAYEFGDGRLVPADGHQRVGLAKRLAAGDPDIRLFGFRLREKDGVTPQMARVIAAMKNVAEGTGDGMDAARVLRDAPGGLKDLPPRSPLVRRAKDLLNLGDQAWGMAWNNVASERDAALVGRLVKDHSMQSAILGHLAKDSPETGEEAELFIRQALAAGAEQQITGDMFGDFLKSDLIFPERANILKASMTALRRDKALFNTLTSRETAIADAGNVLNAAENAKRAETANKAFGVLTALAERKGPISDALQTAAQKSLQGNRRGATADFLAAVRKSVADGSFDRAGDGGHIGPLESSVEGPADHAQHRRSADPEALKPFSDPVKKPEAFRQQADDLAAGLSPPPEKPAGDSGRASGGETAPSPYGAAAPQVEALERLDGAELFADPASGTLTSIKDATAEVKRHARAVERLRGCITGDGA